MTNTALITGGANGIGFGVAKHLLQHGYQLVLTDMCEQVLTPALDRLNSSKVRGLVLDVTDEDQVQAVCAALAGSPVDILINNAGIQHVAPIEQFPFDRWQKIIDVLLTGPARMIKTFLPGMRARNFGRIVNIGSIHGLVASPYKSAYVAAKHGLIGLSKVIALETCDADITINTICPAYVKTPLVEKQIADQARTHGISEAEVIDKIMLEPMPKKSFIDIQEIAHGVKFLASPDCRNMTGQTLVLDGGWTVR